MLNPRWLRAHNKTASSFRNPNPPEHISLSDTSSHLIIQADDLESIYQSEDIGDDLEKANDHLHYNNNNEDGPSNLGHGRGKDINLFPGMRDYLNDPISEDENSLGKYDHFDIIEDEALSVSL